MKKTLYILFTIVIGLGVFSACTSEDLDPTLAQSKSVEGSINTAEDVFGILSGAYNRVTSSAYYGRNFIIWGEVRSDNCYSNGNSGRFVTDAEMNYTDNFGGHWAQAYSVIASANIVIALDPAALDGDADVISHYQGQAYAIRALAHYDLLLYYGQQHTGGSLGVPYVTEYKGEDNLPSRKSVDECKNMIMDDLAMAISMMNKANDDPSKQYFTYYGAQALKARVALYFKDYDAVIAAAGEIMGSGAYSIIGADDLANSFLIDGASNSIFELAFSSVDNANINGLQQIYRGPAYGDVQPLDDLINLFDETDVRGMDPMLGEDPEVEGRISNLGKYPSYDYSDNIPILRYEEIVLAYAEALLKKGQTAQALEQLNSVPAKRNAGLYDAATEDNILTERRKELCFEGMRFHDLARTGKGIPEVDALLQRHGGPGYGDYKYAFPIPQVEMDVNPNMVQNSGY